MSKHKKTSNNLPGLLSAGNTQGGQDDPDDEHGDAGLAGDRCRAPLDLIRHILQHQVVAITLWIVHTFVYYRFSITPRLALLSPVRGCGKTTVLNITMALACRCIGTSWLHWRICRIATVKCSGDLTTNLMLGHAVPPTYRLGARSVRLFRAP